MSTKTVLFVNLRRTPHEGRAALFAARRLGYDVVLLADKVPEYTAGLLADVAIVDTYDLDQAMAGARALADRHHVRGVVTWADRDVELVAQIGQALGLPAPTPAAARRARNKFEMKQALAHLDGVVPRHARVRTWADLEAAVHDIGLPAVLKPAGASGSKGIFELRRPDDLARAFAQLLRIARPDSDPIFRHFGAEFIVEEYLAGPEFSVEGWVCNGQVHVVGISDKWTTDPYHLEYQHIHPTRLAERDQREICEKTALVVGTLGLDYCAFHLECKLTPRGFRLVEVAARIGGDYITSHLIPLSRRVDFYGQVIRVVMGEQPTWEPAEQLYAGVRFLLAGGDGRLVGLQGVEAALQLPAVEHLFLEAAPGTNITLPPDNFATQRVAAVIARHADYDVVNDTLEEAERRCVVTVAASEPALVEEIMQ
jgi:biotin carboxylase